MNLQIPSPQLKAGDYTTTRGTDNADERADAERVLRLNGCRSVRFETMTDGRLLAHGYLAQLVF